MASDGELGPNLAEAALRFLSTAGLALGTVPPNGAGSFKDDAVVSLYVDPPNTPRAGTLLCPIGTPARTVPGTCRIVWQPTYHPAMKIQWTKGHD